MRFQKALYVWGVPSIGMTHASYEATVRESVAERRRRSQRPRIKGTAANHITKGKLTNTPSKMS